MIRQILDWFKKAKPNPTNKDLSTQIGCHLEEVHEMLEAIGIPNTQVALLSALFKNTSDTVNLDIINRTELLDALCDQIVTAVGVAHMLELDIIGALDEVNRSNWSKFENGKPVFDSNGKIAKGKDYIKPDLSKFI